VDSPEKKYFHIWKRAAGGGKPIFLLQPNRSASYRGSSIAAFHACLTALTEPHDMSKIEGGRIQLISVKTVLQGKVDKRERESRTGVGEGVDWSNSAFR
jgi:hypothetical protein